MVPFLTMIIALDCTCDRRVPALVVLPYAACACGRDSSASRELALVPTMAKTASESKHMVKNQEWHHGEGRRLPMGHEEVLVICMTIEAYRLSFKFFGLDKVVFCCVLL